MAGGSFEGASDVAGGEVSWPDEQSELAGGWRVTAVECSERLGE
jgi:hypothetical protein